MRQNYPMHPTPYTQLVRTESTGGKEKSVIVVGETMSEDDPR